MKYKKLLFLVLLILLSATGCYDKVKETSNNDIHSAKQGTKESIQDNDTAWK